MAMFVWRSEALRDYGDGWAIVEADNITAARFKAKVEFLNYAIQEATMWESLGGLGNDSIADIEAACATFASDLAAEPKVVGHLFVRGSQ